MLSFGDCGSKEHSGWWDVEEEIQRELKALDVDEVTPASGDAQVEIPEEEKIISAVHLADHFENLMDRLQLQNEKLLQLEQSVFLPERCTEAIQGDTGGSTSRKVDLEFPPKCHSENCFLALQNFIRPLCSLDQEESSYQKDPYTCGKALNKRNKGWEKRLGGYQGLASKSVKDSRNSQQHIHKTENLQLSLGTFNSTKETNNTEDAKRIKHLNNGLLHAWCLSYKVSPLLEMKLSISGINLQRSTAIVTSLRTSNLIFRSSMVSTHQENQVPSELARPHSVSVKPELFQLKNTPRKRALSSRVKEKALIYDFLDLFKSKVIPVNGTGWDVLKQLDTNSLASRQSRNIFDAGSHSLTYSVDQKGLYVLLSLFPELKKLAANVLDRPVERFQCLWMELCSRLSSLHHSRFLLFDAVSENFRGVQLLPHMRNAQLHEADTFPVYKCERSGHSLPYKLEEADINNEDDRKLPPREKGSVLEQGAHLEKLVKLQATIKGFLARKRSQVKVDLQQERLCYCVTKVQAYWRGYIARKSRLPSMEMKSLAPLADGCLHTGSQVECVDFVCNCATSQMTVYGKIVALQAFARGVLARKKKRILLSQREVKTRQFIIRIQAVWRGRRVRKGNHLEELRSESRLKEAAAVKIQAVWRGFRTRRRFLMAIECSRYEEDYDYEYAVVDEIDTSVKEKCFEDFATGCYDSSKDLSWNSSLQLSKPLLQPSLVVEGKGVAGLEQDRDLEHENCLEEFKVDRKNLTDGEQVHFGNKLTHVLVSCDMNSSSVSEREIVTNEVTPIHFQASSEGDPAANSDGSFQKNEEARSAKEQSSDETRTTVAEIARDWGFKEERTALQFLRALENTRRRAERPKTKRPDAQARLRAFMARSGRQKGYQNKGA